MIEDLFRSFMFFFDNIVYSIIPIIYRLFIYLSQIDIFSSDAGLGDLMGQIYALLGIFMLFKISFSILQYLIDPNAFSDSSKGFGKILKNALIAIILLVMVPFIFEFGAKIQYVVINSNILGNLILGSTITSSNSKNNPDITETNFIEMDASELLKNTSAEVEENAKDLQFLMYGAFFSLNTNVVPDCEGTPIFGSIEMAQNYNSGSDTGCLATLETEMAKVDAITSTNTDLASFFKYTGTKNKKGEDCKNGVCDDRDFVAFGNLLTWRIDNEYVINYLPVISTAAGIYIVFLLITFCIDIAVRAIKLAFLQMVAPISIVSYIDPKEDMKNSKLRNWINECLKTYVSLFIRLAVIFFVMRLVSIIASGVFSASGFVRKLDANEYTIWIYVFLVLGAFMFAKQVPKMIETLFGWKGSGELNLNPIKSIKDNALASATIAGVAGAGVGGALGALNAYNTRKSLGGGKARSVLSGAGGVFSGAFRGATNGIQGRQKGFGVRNAVGSIGSIGDSMRMRDKAGLGGQARATVSELSGAPYKADLFDDEIKARETVAGNIDKAKNRAESWVDKQENVKDLNRRLAAARQSGNINEEQRLEKEIKSTRDTMTKTYIEKGVYDAASKTYKKDDQIEAYLTAAQRGVEENKGIKGLNTILDENGNVSWKQAQDVKKSAEKANEVLKASDEYENAVHEKEIRQKSAGRRWTNKQN